MGKNKKFDMSSRLALQIGRNNFSSAEGAVIELVKNSYDADSLLSYVYFDIPLGGDIVNTFQIDDFFNLKKQDTYGINYDNYYIKTKEGDYELINEKKNLLESKIKEKSSIYIIDNGDGMTEKIIDEYWMVMATDNKKKKSTSSRLGRVRTGEKGIGRFALDRLGSEGKMVTSFYNGNDGTLEWKINWADFEEEGKKLSEIDADFEYKNISFNDETYNIFNNTKTKKIPNQFNFDHGTVLQISNLRDLWNKDKVMNLLDSLSNLIPPVGIEKFDIFVDASFLEKEIEVKEEVRLDFDYKLESNYNGSEFSFKIFREEFDVGKIPFDFLSKNNSYEKKNFSEFCFSKPAEKFLINFSEDELISLKNMGNFTFNFSFLKKRVADKKHYDEFKYKTIVLDRSKRLERFSGIKIFRDHFKVRPYGEGLGSAWDWLSLGNRASSDPSAPSRPFRWKVRPDNIIGELNISRVHNKTLIDKSNREGLIENKDFNLLNKILIEIIKVFENDRSVLLSLLKEKHALVHPMESLLDETDEALILDDNDTKTEEEKEEERKKWSKKKFEEEYKKKEQEAKNARKSYRHKKKQLAEKIDENRLVNTLATKGVIFNSLQHEIKENKNQVKSYLSFLGKILHKNLDENSFMNEKSFKNPFITFGVIKKNFDKLIEWVDISLTSTKKDRRYTKDVLLKDYFKEFALNWDVYFKKRSINFSYPKESNSTLKCFELELDTIFQNLIMNSGEAFDKNNQKDKNINIEITEKKDYLYIIYSDNGPGLDMSKLDSKNDIFKPDISTKKDGTGLGMWLLKGTIDGINKSSVDILDSDGFSMELKFKI